MKLTRIAMTGAAGVMGLGLIGVGAHAAFTTTTQSHQTVSAGTLSMVLTSPGATGNGTKAIQLAASPNNASSFTTGTIPVTAVNNGSLTAYNIQSTISVTDGGGGPTTALANEAFVCLVGTGSGSPFVIYNGTLAGAPHSQPVAGTEHPGTKAQYIINVYAGKEPTKCGSSTTYGSAASGGTSTSPSLLNTAEGGSFTITETLTYDA
jgi:hypothetical protein